MADWIDNDYTITDHRAFRGVKATYQATGKPGHDVSVPLTNLDPGFSGAAGSSDRADDSIPKFVLNGGKAL
ncbi:hypothetical protein E4U11_003010 [Claviceps purpurea]|nr:hypothetical protein E4U11_003010 [Claviceps purpurea]